MGVLKGIFKCKFLWGPRYIILIREEMAFWSLSFFTFLPLRSTTKMTRLVGFSNCIRECTEMSHLIAQIGFAGGKWSEVPGLVHCGTGQQSQNRSHSPSVPHGAASVRQPWPHACHHFQRTMCIQNLGENSNFLLKYRIDYGIECRNHLDFKETGGFKEMCIC